MAPKEFSAFAEADGTGTKIKKPLKNLQRLLVYFKGVYFFIRSKINLPVAELLLIG